jgi:hypothetical protein
VLLFALPDTTPVPLRAVWTAMHFDSLQARERIIADSLRHAKDTTARAPLKPEPARPSPGAVGAPRRPMAPLQEAGRVRADTARIRQLLGLRPVPTDRWVARAATVLTPGKYLVRVRGATNLNGAAADAQAVLTVAVPKAPPAPRDTTRAAPPGKPR